MNIKERVVGQNGIYLFHHPYLLLFLLKSFLISNGNELGYSQAYGKQSLKWIGGLYILYRVLTCSNVSFEVKDKVLFPHSATHFVLYLLLKLFETLDCFSPCHSPYRKNSFRHLSEILSFSILICVVEIEKVVFRQF